MKKHHKKLIALFFIKRMVRRYIDDNVGALSAEATYYFILGLIPFLIFVVNMVLFFSASQIQLIVRILSYLPQAVAASMQNNIYRIIQSRSIIWMLGGLIFSLWTSSRGVQTLISATDQCFFDNRNLQPYIRRCAKSIVFTVLITFAMILTLGLIVFANAVVYALFNYFRLNHILLDIWNIFRFTIPFCVLVLSMALFYRFAPQQKIAKSSTILITSLLVTIIWLILTAAYGFYVQHISSMGITYGSLIGLVVLFIWFHLAAIVIIMGGEFIMAWHETSNAIRSMNRVREQIRKEENPDHSLDL